MPDGDCPDSSRDEPGRPGGLGSVALAFGALAVLSAAAVLVLSAITTASARIAGGTENTSSLLEAAVIELDTGAGDGGDDAGPRTLFLEGAGLHPGLRLERCVLVRYTGSLAEVSVMLSAWLERGTGLERHLGVVLTPGSGADPQCGDFVATEPPVFDGTLAQLATRHPRFEDGLWVADLASSETTALRVQVEVGSDDDAQGLSTRVGFRFEVRP